MIHAEECESRCALQRYGDQPGGFSERIQCDGGVMTKYDLLFQQLFDLASSKRAQRGNDAPGTVMQPAPSIAANRNSVREVEIEVARRFSMGESYNAIAHALNRKGLRGRYGGRWYGGTVRAVVGQLKASANRSPGLERKGVRRRTN